MPITINGVVYRNLEDQVAYLTKGYNDLSVISTYMPSDVSAQNKLASRSYVDQAVTTVAAHYLTSDAEGDNFPTKAALLAGPYYYGAEEHDPDENDYAFVNADEEHNGLPSRYAFINDAWQYQYSLQASGGVVDLTSAQTITGVKTFGNGFKVKNYVFEENSSGVFTLKHSTYGAIADFYPTTLIYIQRSLYPYENDRFSIGGNGAAWKDIYLSGACKCLYIQNPNSALYVTANSLSPDGSSVDLGSNDAKWKDLYLSGNIIGSYKEANEVVKSGTLNTGRFQMTADEVNKIKYIEIYVDTIGGDSSVSMMIPVSAWNMSQWTSNHEVNTNGLAFDTINVMYNNGNLYVALDAMNSGHTVQFFAKMI